MAHLFYGEIMNQYIQGIFGGALIICLLMLNFPKHKTCEVNLQGQRIGHVSIGIWND